MRCHCQCRAIHISCVACDTFVPERLTVDQNKQLCKAAKLRHGGNKKELMERLLEDEQTSKFAPEGKYVSLNVDAIKEMCRSRDLQVGGTRFDLVLRILHCDNDTTPAGATLKRAATDVTSTVDPATGEAVETRVPKKRKKAAPNPGRAYDRVQKEIEAVRQKKYQSYWGSKFHSEDVYGLVGGIIHEVLESEENYLENDPKFALKMAEAVCTSLVDNFGTMQRPGYDCQGGWSMIDDSLRQIAEAAKPLLSEEEREHFASWVQDLENTGEPYGLNMDHDFVGTIKFLRNDEPEKSEEADVDDRKVAAVEKKSATNEGNAVNENIANGATLA